MFVDADLISYNYYQYDKGQYTLNPVVKSGEKEEDKLNDELNFSDKNPAVLILEEDIINKEGYGLKKGFYNITTDKYMDYLYIYQTGNLKAKIPVINMEVFETINPKQNKVKKMSYKRFLKEEEKKRQKYLKGQNPLEVDYKEAKIQYINEQNCYIIIYNFNNIELTGIIKF